MGCFDSLTKQPTIIQYFVSKDIKKKKNCRNFTPNLNKHKTISTIL